MATNETTETPAADRLRIALAALGLCGLVPADRPPTAAELATVQERLNGLNVSPPRAAALDAIDELA